MIAPIVVLRTAQRLRAEPLSGRGQVFLNMRAWLAGQLTGDWRQTARVYRGGLLDDQTFSAKLEQWPWLATDNFRGALCKQLAEHRTVTPFLPFAVAPYG